MLELCQELEDDNSIPPGVLIGDVRLQLEKLAKLGVEIERLEPDASVPLPPRGLTPPLPPLTPPPSPKLSAAAPDDDDGKKVTDPEVGDQEGSTA
jgi:hypothetical protein